METKRLKFLIEKKKAEIGLLKLKLEKAEEKLSSLCRLLKNKEIEEVSSLFSNEEDMAKIQMNIFKMAKKKAIEEPKKN